MSLKTPILGCTSCKVVVKNRGVQIIENMACTRCGCDQDKDSDLRMGFYSRLCRSCEVISQTNTSEAVKSWMNFQIIKQQLITSPTFGEGLAKVHIIPPRITRSTTKNSVKKRVYYEDKIHFASMQQFPSSWQYQSV